MRTRPFSRRLLVGAAALVLAATIAPLALAGFASAIAAGAQTLTSATLAAPTGLTATCANSIASLSWTATGSSYADGYDILRGTTSGGPYPTTFRITGRTTTTYNDTTTNGIATYYYVARATKNNWRSANTAQITVNSSNC
jgi:hypothetical protein